MPYGFTALLAFQPMGEGLDQALGLPLPGPLIGMLLLFGALVLRGGIPDPLRDAANALLHADQRAWQWQAKCLGEPFPQQLERKQGCESVEHGDDPRDE